MNLGDYTPGAPVSVLFPTINILTGVATAPVGLALGILRNGETTPVTTGLSLSVNHVFTGMHRAVINTRADAAYFAFGNQYELVAIAGTIAGNSVVGLPVATFSLGLDSLVLDAGIPQAVTSTQTTIRAAANFANGTLTAALLRVRGSDQGYFVSVPITTNVGDVITHPPLVPVPSGTLDYEIRDTVGASSTSGGLDAAGVRAAIGLPAADLGARLDTLQTSVNSANSSLGTINTKIDTIDDFVDTEVAAIKAVTDKLDTTLETTGPNWRYTVSALGNAPTGAGASVSSIAAAVWNEAVDGAVTARESVRLVNSAVGGVASGLQTTVATFRDLANTKARITATVDADGNRTVVTRDLT
jgi:hypothetical protein